jgi:hypothetical protein
MVAINKGPFPNFYEAFTQLHIDQLLAFKKCTSRDRRDGGINSNADHILRNNSSSLPRVDEDLGIDRGDLGIGGIARHWP